MSNYIPADVRRELRQESNYGCAICGAPVIDYHHIIPRREKDHNNPEDMIALCPNHHRPADDGAISRSKLYEYKESPFNSDKVDYFLHFDSGKPRFRMGELDIVVGEEARHSIFSLGGHEVFSMIYRDGILTFDMEIHDKDGNLIAEISNNEWKAKTNDIWDLKYKSKKLSLWDPNEELRLRLTYNDDEDLIKFEAKFYYDGLDVKVLPSKITTSTGGTVKGGGEIIMSGNFDGTLFSVNHDTEGIQLAVY